MFSDLKQNQVMDRTTLCVSVVIRMCKTQEYRAKRRKACPASSQHPPKPQTVTSIPANCPVIPQQN